MGYTTLEPGSSLQYKQSEGQSSSEVSTAYPVVVKGVEGGWHHYYSCIFSILGLANHEGVWQRFVIIPIWARMVPRPIPPSLFTCTVKHQASPVSPVTAPQPITNIKLYAFGEGGGVWMVWCVFGGEGGGGGGGGAARSIHFQN